MSKEKVKKVTVSNKQWLSIVLVTALVLAGIVTVSFMSFAGTCKTGSVSGCPTVKKGSTGSAVKVLQKELNVVCTTSSKITVDGNFGSATQSRVKGFQKDYDSHYKGALTVDGIVGSKTWRATNIIYKNGGSYPDGEQPNSVCK